MLPSVKMGFGEILFCRETLFDLGLWMTAKKLILPLFPGLFPGLFLGLVISIVPALLPGNSQAQTGADPARQIELKLRDIFFDSTQYSIRAVDESILEDVANILLKNPRLTIILEGYTDVKGEEDYNLELARRRTIEVKQHLLGLGVDPDAVISVYRGETTRFAEGTSEEALQLNRRVKFVPKENPGCLFSGHRWSLRRRSKKSTPSRRLRSHRSRKL